MILGCFVSVVFDVVLVFDLHPIQIINGTRKINKLLFKFFM
jgi:hypothetical protein